MNPTHHESISVTWAMNLFNVVHAFTALQIGITLMMRIYYNNNKNTERWKERECRWNSNCTLSLAQVKSIWFFWFFVTVLNVQTHAQYNCRNKSVWFTSYCLVLKRNEKLYNMMWTWPKSHPLAININLFKQINIIKCN